MSQIHSTGRGGAGNIGPDEHVYVDGDIVREGTSTPGATHVGRGGAGNIPVGAPAVAGAPAQPQSTVSGKVYSEDYVPETATRGTEGHENFHTGRGGEGNVYREKYGGHSHAQTGEGETLIDKAKHLLHLDKKEPKQPEAK